MPTNRDLRKYAAHEEADCMMASLCRYRAEETIAAMAPATEGERLLQLRAVAALREMTAYHRAINLRAGQILQHHGVQRVFSFMPDPQLRLLDKAA